MSWAHCILHSNLVKPVLYHCPCWHKVKKDPQKGCTGKPQSEHLCGAGFLLGDSGDFSPDFSWDPLLAKHRRCWEDFMILIPSCYLFLDVPAWLFWTQLHLIDPGQATLGCVAWPIEVGSRCIKKKEEAAGKCCPTWLHPYDDHILKSQGLQQPLMDLCLPLNCWT